ncbi:Bardet-Biedl syndrome 10 protein [Hippoglossus stenolepis]|uniref:Bardet-Biedl syndrome 10 protein n=1 Tax=Hippoglossus stenolepis TaxID=195615 RepID=UPI00159C59BB|nr:Bardet-Biedl syndrome 10 protein [Hippoglossus stenolepis]
MVVEMLPVDRLHLKHVLQTVGALEATVLRSFGPEGGQVLFTRDTGQAMLSRSGTRILKALRLEYPLARMVVECVWKHSSSTGDGSKTFILLLASLLRMIHTKACKEPNVSHTYSSREAAEAATARRFADELLTFALEDLEDLIAVGVAPYGFCVSWEDFTAKSHPPAAHSDTHCVQKLLASFFHTRLGHTHCDFISNLTCEVLRNWTFINDLPSSALHFVNDNFPALHTPVTGFPISCSRLIEGQVIHRDFAVPCPRTEDQSVKAVVFSGYLQPRILSAGDVLKVGCGGQVAEEKSLVEFSAWSERSLQCVIANLQRLGVSVLLSAVKQSAAVLALAAQARMCVVECISKDELALFAKLSGTTPVSDCWTIESQNVSTLTFCRPILLGVHRYVHVAFHDLEKRVTLKPCSLVICGAGEGQTDQCACAFQDAIRMLLVTFQPMGRTSTTASNRIYQFHNSTSSHASDHSDRTTHTSSNAILSQQCVLEPGCVISAGGTFEFLLNHALSQHPRCRCVSNGTKMSTPAVSQLLANALLSVPQQIYSHSVRHFLQIQTRILSFLPKDSHTFSVLYKQKSSTSLVQACCTSGFPVADCKLSMHCCRKTDVLSKAFMLDLGLESVSCKYQLLLAVLQCVRSLLRVDMVLHTHSALHAQSRRPADVSSEGSEDEAED